MNKKDTNLIIIIFTISIIIILGYRLFEKDGIKNALVYYENDLILTIDLTTEEKTYYVDGYNGKIKILAGNGRVSVDEENSPLHLCSKQGYISKSYETIVCLPNKVIIKIENKDELDAIVK